MTSIPFWTEELLTERNRAVKDLYTLGCQKNCLTLSSLGPTCHFLLPLTPYASSRQRRRAMVGAKPSRPRRGRPGHTAVLPRSPWPSWPRHGRPVRPRHGHSCRAVVPAVAALAVHRPRPSGHHRGRTRLAPAPRRRASPREASPHKRRLKCDTNISPRRLITHLLHQMVHHHTTLRGNGQ